MQKNNIVYFDTDAEITNYCLSKFIKPVYDENIGRYGYDLMYSENYINDLRNGIKYHVKDPKSHVMKHKCVSRSLINKPIENLIAAEDIFTEE